MESIALRKDFGDKTILELRHLYQSGRLNLEPGFQRKSVWSLRDRQFLIQSILEGYPLPSIFLYERDDRGRLVYDVIDGKQRLETIFRFIGEKGFGRQTFEVPFRFKEDERTYIYRWNDLENWGKAAEFDKYKIQTVEVAGGMTEIIDLFVRINSTGKALNQAERRNAKYFKSDLLIEADRISKKHRSFFLTSYIFRTPQIERMKDIELVCELLLGQIEGEPGDKKVAIDRAISSERIKTRSLAKARKEFAANIRCIKALLPEIQSTRFQNTTEFYTLFLVVHQLRQERALFSNKRQLANARDILTRFSNAVDEVQQAQVKGKKSKSSNQLYTDYLAVTTQRTDNKSIRQSRAKIILSLLAGVLSRKDSQRIFNTEQRRILWNSDMEHVCALCSTKLSWNNFQVDHIKPHSRGGKTALKNASLVCASCNASKGAKRGTRTNRTKPPKSVRRRRQ